MQPLKRHFDAIADRAMKRHGRAFGEILRNWPLIAPRAHAFCRPESLSRPRGSEGRKRPAALRLRVAPGRALELQHMQDEIIAAVNAYFGYALVGKLTFVQAPLEETERAKPPPSPPRPDPALRSRLAGRARRVRDPALRESLLRLAGALSARKGPKGP